MLHSSRSVWSVAVATALAASGCEDGRKASEQSAADEVQRLAPVVKEDVAQVRKGLPAGAAKLATLLDADTLGTPSGVQHAIGVARASVKDLELAKSTFFTFTDTTGRVVRSEIDPDLLATKSLFEPFPGLQKALAPKAGVVEVFGEMAELRGVRTGADLAWVVADAVTDAAGPKGLFVTGWSFRLFAYHLEQMAKRHLIDAKEKEGWKNVPIVYVFVLKGRTAYGAPVTPDVNAQAVESLGLLEKTAAGPFRSSLEITGRGFGVAAQRAPELGDDAAVAVLLTHI